jgi:hypothetical protein
MGDGPSRKIAAALVVAFSALCWCAPGAFAGERGVDAGNPDLPDYSDFIVVRVPSLR